MEGRLWAATGAMAAIAIPALGLAVWDYLGIELVQACPLLQGVAGLCLPFDFGGQQYAVTFDSGSFEAQDTPVLLAGMLAGSAAILAISFTLNQVVLSNISQRYSSKLVESYTKNPAIAFVAFVMMVAGSAALLLAYNSLPPWLAACFVLALTSGFFVALWFFAKEFMRMMLVMSPYGFIEDARKKILASKGSKIKSAPVRSSIESRSLIRALGDTAVKSMATNDDDICMACIDELGEVGKASLYKNGDKPDESKVVNEPGDDRSYTNTGYVIEEFDRILKHSTEKKDSPVTRHIVEKLDETAKMAMENENNRDAITGLYDTGGLKASLYLRWMERIADVGGEYDKNRIIHHLAHLSSAMGGTHMEFVEQFIAYHVFRSVKSMIDKDDLEMFKEIIFVFSNHHLFSNMENKRNVVKAGISDRCKGRPDIAAQRDKIVFEIDYYTKKDFGRIRGLKREVEGLLAQTSPSFVSDSDQRLLKDMDQLYVYSLLWGTFFRIACYIIGKIIDKGDKYVEYLWELWHSPAPYGQFRGSANKPPCAKDVDWNTLYSIWSGKSGLEHSEISDRASVYKPHYYEYAVLHMLREDSVFTVPAEIDATKWGSHGEHYALEYHYENMRRMSGEMFLEALDSIAESRLPNKILNVADVRTRIESVREKLKQFEVDREHLMGKFAELIPMDDGKISEWKTKSRSEYFENTRAEVMARTEYDTQIHENDVVGRKIEMPHEALCGGANVLIDGDLGCATAKAEFEKILEIAGNSAICVKVGPDKPQTSIEECVRIIRDRGHNPSVAFVSPHHMSPETHATGAINAGGPPIQIIDAPMQIPPKDTWILDPDCIKITYKAKDKTGRIQLDVQDAGVRMEAMISSIPMSVKILDGSGIARLTSDEA